MDSSTLSFWAGLFLKERVTSYFLLLLCFIAIPVFNANSIDPDQTPRSVASDLGQHYLLMSLLCDTEYKYVKKVL